MQCNYCGASLRHTARVCIQCGTAVPEAAPEATPEADHITAPGPRPPIPAAEPAPAAPAAPTAPETSPEPQSPADHSADQSEGQHTETATPQLHEVLSTVLGTNTPAVVNELMVQAGDTVHTGQGLLVLETDQFLLEMPSDFEGQIRSVAVRVGDDVTPGTVLMTLYGVRTVEAETPAPIGLPDVNTGAYPIIEPDPEPNFDLANDAATDTPAPQPAASGGSFWSTVGWWLLGMAVGGGAYLLVQAFRTPDMPTASKGATAVSQLRAPPAPASATPASNITINTDDLNHMLGLASAAQWADIQTLLQNKRPQTHLIKDKGVARVFNDSGIEFINKGEWQSGQVFFEMGVEANPNDAEIRNNLGFAEMRLGNRSKAQEHLVNTLLMAPSRTNAWSNLAELMADAQDPATSRAALMLAVHFSRNQRRTLEFLADPARIPSPALRNVVQAHWADIQGVPPYAR